MTRAVDPCGHRSRLGWAGLLLALWGGDVPPASAQPVGASNAGPLPTDLKPADLSINYQVKVHRALGFVRGIEQTDDGYLWIASSFGLARYDGAVFTFFDSANTPAIKDDTIVALHKSRDGSLWLATARGGVVRFAEHRFTHFPVPVPITSSSLCCVKQDQRGDIWIGSNQHGLFRLEGDEFRPVPAGAGSPPAAVHTMFTTREGDILVGTGAGFVRIQRGRVEPVPAAELAGRSRSELVLAQSLLQGDRAWPATASVWDGLPGGKDFAPNAVAIDRDGAAWIGGEGLYRLADGKIREWSYADGLPSRNLNALFEDREGNLWVGHFGTGVTQMTRTPFIPFAYRRGLGGGAPFSVVETPGGAVWVSGSSFFSYFKDGQFRNFHQSESLPVWDLRSMAAGPDERVWANNQHGDVYELTPSSFIRHRVPGQSAGEFSTSLLVDRDGRLWSGSSLGGLLRWSGQTFERIATPEMGASGCTGPINLDFPCRHAINVIQQSHTGDLLLGTHGSGLWRRSAAGTTARLAAAALDDATVYALHEDQQATLWVGTDRGVFVFPAPGAGLAGPLHFTRADGLVSDGIFQFVEDGLGQLWMGSDRGIFHLRKGDFFARGRGARAKLDPVSFRAIDGIPSDEVIRRFEPHGVRTRDGRLWFATVAGLAIFNPPEKEPRPPQPRALLERVVLKKHEFTPPFGTDIPEVASGGGDLEFHYTAPSFASPHRVQFEYKLDGFDAEAIDAGPRRAAFYTNIPPGQYTFRVSARSAESGRSDAVATFTFRLRPMFHQTWAFFAAIGVLVIAAAFGLQRLRITRLKARYALIEGERNRIAGDLHDTLAQVFSAMGFQLDSAAGLAGEGAPVLKERLKRVRQMVAHGRLAARNVILNLRSERGDAPPGRGLQIMLEAIPPVYDSAQIAVNITGEARPIAPAIENELFHIAQEAVSNAIEHGKASLISIDLEYAADRIELWIHDDGLGFEARERGTEEPRFGLKGMKERAARVGGTFTMHTEAGVGTEIGVVISLVGNPKAT